MKAGVAPEIDQAFLREPSSSIRVFRELVNLKVAVGSAFVRRCVGFGSRIVHFELFLDISGFELPA